MSRLLPTARRHRRTLLALTAAALAAGLVTACGSAASHPASGRSGSPASNTPPAAPSPYGTNTASTVRMVVNGGHRLAFYVTPGRLPAVVLDSGGGNDASSWKNIVPALSRNTGSEIITYDRAGMGASDEVPGPWKVADAVSDLAAGLTALGVSHDVVLVSHSEAGEIATGFVNDHPGWVSGAVLVDASLPDFYTDAETARIVAANKDQIAALANQPSTKQTRQLIAVAQDYGPAHQAYHRLTWPQNIPATVIVSAKTPFDTSPADAQLWRDAQAAFAAKAGNRQLVTATGSSHDVPIDRPGVVIQAVDAMVARAADQ